MRCEREHLPARGSRRGPLVITELSATTVVPPGWTARVLPTADLLLAPATRAPGRRQPR
jgi:hypothetical protein